MAINRAIELKDQGREVTLVDLDIVEPFYTLRPLVKILKTKGINVIAFNRNQSFGLGETGVMLNPKAKWALKNEGDIILDIGYGVNGARTLNLVEGANESLDLKVIMVINFARPMTNSGERIKEYIKSLERVDGIVANTHLGDDNDPEFIIAGNNIIIQVAGEIQIPVKFITRYMPDAIW